MTERFKKAYDSLVRAYFEGTLAKGTCVACACGNIIFDAIGDPVTREDLVKEIEYCVGQDLTIASPKRNIVQHVWAGKRTMAGGKFVAHPWEEKQVNEAGYTTEEFAEIENAFEGSTEHGFTGYHKIDEQEILEDQYKGLCAVVDVLIQLDEAQENPDELKKKFREHPKLETA